LTGWEGIPETNVRIGKKCAATLPGEQEIEEVFFQILKRNRSNFHVPSFRSKKVPHVDPWDKFVATEVTGSYYVVANGGGDIFGI
jgi:hypothetical protein